MTVSAKIRNRTRSLEKRVIVDLENFEKRPMFVKQNSNIKLINISRNKNAKVTKMSFDYLNLRWV